MAVISSVLPAILIRSRKITAGVNAMTRHRDLAAPPSNVASMNMRYRAPMRRERTVRLVNTIFPVCGLAVVIGRVTGVAGIYVSPPQRLMS